MNNQIIFDKQNKSKSLKKRSNNTFAFAEKTYVKFGNIAKSIKFKEYVLTKRFFLRAHISRSVSSYSSSGWRSPGHGWASYGGNGVTILARTTMTSRIEQPCSVLSNKKNFRSNQCGNCFYKWKRVLYVYGFIGEAKWLERIACRNKGKERRNALYVEIERDNCRRFDFNVFARNVSAQEIPNNS